MWALRCADPFRSKLNKCSHLTTALDCTIYRRERPTETLISREFASSQTHTTLMALLVASPPSVRCRRCRTRRGLAADSGCCENCLDRRGTNGLIWVRFFRRHLHAPWWVNTRCSPSLFTPGHGHRRRTTWRKARRLRC
jgi:hypothetical protein